MALPKFLKPLKVVYKAFFGARERKDYVPQAVSVAIASVFGNRSMVKQTWDGAQSLSGARDVAVLVTWDATGRVHDFLISHMKGLAEAGRAVILVSNSPKFPKAEVEKALPHCALVAWRSNRGYDFGAYRDGLMLVPEYDALDSLILVNDSTYGPFQKLGPVLRKMRPVDADVWGLTENWDTRWHLQSYFLLFHRAALQNAKVRKLWDDWKHVNSKSWIINKLEIGLTPRLTKAGLRCKALWPYRPLVTRFCRDVHEYDLINDESLAEDHRNLLKFMCHLADHGAPMNPCHFFWDALIADGFPYIKREVLTSNPIGMPRLYEWDQVIGDVSRYPAEQIVDHLRAISKNRVI
ncbi:MAG: polysaccharide biosynthesis-like protein [Maricaulis sp.]|nr:polysaccharide biosynthesis-like protein [Maricaulis sp.]HAQ35288.1 polysaccharide biosynthesis-like protein [Alphaproteobacteria bacterium]